MENNVLTIMEGLRQKPGENPWLKVLEKSQKLQDLVFSVRFVVKEALVNTYQDLITIQSEQLWESRTPPYERQTGYHSCLFLKVMPGSKNIPIREIIFKGFSSVVSGDIISARIPRYQEKMLEKYPGVKVRSYFDRPYKESENAIELSILSKEGSVLRTERSIEYRNFFKS